MGRAALFALPLAAVLGVVAFLWWLRGEAGPVANVRGSEPAPAEPETKATVTGTVTGRYGVVWGVHITAEARGRLLAETWTDPNGRFALEAPAGVLFDLCAIPIPQTYLIKEHRPLSLRPGEETDVAFALESIPVTEGTITGLAFSSGDSAFAMWLYLCAVREDASGEKVWADLHGSNFQLWGLRKGAPYHIEVEGVMWELERPVVFRAGESGIDVPLRRMLWMYLDVRDVRTRTDIAAFSVKVLDPQGQVFKTLEGRNGHLTWRAPHPNPEEPWDARWTPLVSAEGYFETAATRSLEYLQPVRDPNLVLYVSLEDGTPYKGDLAARGFSQDNWCDVDARARKLDPGRYEAVLPVGRWRVRVDSDAGSGVTPHEVIVRDWGTVDVEIPPLARDRRVPHRDLVSWGSR